MLKGKDFAVWFPKKNIQEPVLIKQNYFIQLFITKLRVQSTQEVAEAILSLPQFACRSRLILCTPSDSITGNPLLI